jgi:hypothetical protein
MSKLFTAVLMVFFTCTVLAITDIETFEIRSYYPESQGVRDLTFEVRIKDLMQRLNEESMFGKLTDVYFQVYWLFPDKFNIEVMGLPKGFKERKELLKGLIVSRLDFVLPQKISKMVKNYNLTAKKIADGTYVEALDKSGINDVNRIELIFDKESKLTAMKLFASSGIVESKLFFQTYPWSQNKWALEKSSSEQMALGRKTTVDSTVAYTNVQGYGFPGEVVITTKVSSLYKKLKEQKDLGELKNVINFSNYQVNAGKAAEYFKQNQLKPPSSR